MALAKVAVAVALPSDAGLMNETESAPVASRAAARLPSALRIGSHALAWVLVLIPAGIQMSDGWLPTRDDAMISIGSDPVFLSACGPRHQRAWATPSTTWARFCSGYWPHPSDSMPTKGHCGARPCSAG